MTAQHKTEKAARMLAFAAAAESWHKLDARSDLGSAMQLATIRYQNTTQASCFVKETRNH